MHYSQEISIHAKLGKNQGTNMRYLLTFAIFIFATTHAMAETKQGIALYNAGNYEGAEQEFLGPVAAGDPVAIRYYANMLYIGRGVSQDRERAKSILRAAYINGDTASGTYLAELLTEFMLHFSIDEKPTDKTARLTEATRLFEETYTGPTSQEPATNIIMTFIDTKGQIAPKGNIITWLKRGVREGHAESAWYLARAYFAGNAVEKDAKQAFYWAEYAAFLDHPEAQTIVGELYAEGRFGPANPDAGMALIVQSAKQRHNPAMVHVAGYFAGEGDDPGMAWRVLQLAYDRGMEKTDNSKRMEEFIRTRGGHVSARSIEDYAYSGRFETLIQQTLPTYNAALQDFRKRIKPSTE
jgi:TPR repeat protein